MGPRLLGHYAPGSPIHALRRRELPYGRCHLVEDLFELCLHAWIFHDARRDLEDRSFERGERICRRLDMVNFDITREELPARFGQDWVFHWVCLKVVMIL